MTIKEIQEEIIDEFSMFDDWMERYEYIIELGKSLPVINEDYKLDENLIKGCQSKVWLYSELENNIIKYLWLNVSQASANAPKSGELMRVLIWFFSDVASSFIFAGILNSLKYDYHYNKFRRL